MQMLLAALVGWLEREQRDVIAFLREENRVLKAPLARRRLRLDDGQRRRLAMLGHRLARSRSRASSEPKASHHVVSGRHRGTHSCGRIGPTALHSGWTRPSFRTVRDQHATSASSWLIDVAELALAVCLQSFIRARTFAATEPLALCPFQEICVPDRLAAWDS